MLITVTDQIEEEGIYVVVKCFVIQEQFAQERQILTVLLVFAFAINLRHSNQPAGCPASVVTQFVCYSLCYSQQERLDGSSWMRAAGCTSNTEMLSFR